MEDAMTEQRKGSLLRVRCVCGWEATDMLDGAVDAAIEHGRRVHNMTATREVILATAEWVDPTASPGEQA
jgi:hypothetical protein